MGWNEFQGWLKVMQKQLEPPTVTPESWEGADRDPWWQQARAARSAHRT